MMLERTLPFHANSTPVEAQPDLANQVLEALNRKVEISSSNEFPAALDGELKAALDRLRSRSMVEYEQLRESRVILEDEGQKICASNSPEYTVWQAVEYEGKVAINELAVCALYLSKLYCQLTRSCRL